MKFLTIVFLLVSAEAFAVEKHEVFNITAMVPVMNGLRCVVEAGSGKLSQRTYAQLGDQMGRDLMLGNSGGIIELKHKLASRQGCKLEKLDKIVDESMQNYGYKINASIKIVKDTSPSRLNGYGECIADYDETLTIDLGYGVILTSQESEWRHVSDCPVSNDEKK